MFLLIIIICRVWSELSYSLLVTSDSPEGGKDEVLPFSKGGTPPRRRIVFLYYCMLCST